MRSICLIYSGTPEAAAEQGMVDAVLANDEFILTRYGARGLDRCFDTGAQAAMEPRIYRYVDFWGAGFFCSADSAGEGVPTWIPGPGDVNEAAPRIRSPKGPYPYRIDAHHPQRFARWIYNLCLAFPDQAGVFCDDWTPQVNWWRLDTQDIKRVWPDWQPGDWMDGPQQDTESYIRALAAINNRQKVIVNGDGRRLGSRMWESFGKWCSPSEVKADARPGDVLLVKGVDLSRSGWAVTTRVEGDYAIGTSFLDVFKDALEIAEKYGLRVALTTESKPEGGGSSVHEFTDPKTWESL